MTLVRCKVGYAKTQVGSETYAFEIDAAGRFVCDVHDFRHVQILTSAGTYEIVEPLPRADAGPVAQPGPDPLELLRAELKNATAPQIRDIPAADGEHRFYVLANWPELIALPVKDILEGLPGFAIIDPNDRLLLNVINGKSAYDLKGTVDETRLYALRQGSEIDLTSIPDATDAGVATQTTTTTTTTDQTQTTTTQEPAADRKGLIDVKGIGEAMVKRLATAGITTLEQLVALTDAQLAKLDTDLKLHDAVKRDQWIEQAKALLGIAPAPAA